jgi:hypothetical protein
MLPGIYSQNRLKLPDNRVLVRIRLDSDSSRLCILDQPRPPTSLNARQGRVELVLEGIQTPVALVNRRRKLSRRRLTAALAGRREVLPEERVVDVAAAVEVDERLERDLLLDRLDRGRSLRFFELRAEVVERGYVGVVVVLVVQLHDLAADGRLEGAVVICGPSISSSYSTYSKDGP